MEYTLCVWREQDWHEGPWPQSIVRMGFSSLEYAKGVGRSITKAWGSDFAWDVLALRGGEWQVVAHMEDSA